MWPMTELWEKRPQPRGGAHGAQVSLRARHRFKLKTSQPTAPLTLPTKAHWEGAWKVSPDTVKRDGSETKLDRLPAYCITAFPPRRKGRPRRAG